jgi:UDPglucose 6-dehydrogenase
MSTDPRIGPHFINAGIGYGGSCFPKDVQALIYTGDKFGENLTILKAVEDGNYLQRARFFEKIKNHFGGNLKGRKIAIWGVAFKPGTDDIREAPAIDMMEQFLEAGAFLRVYDPVAESNTLKHFGDDILLDFVQDPYEALEEAEALCIFTEWADFRNPDFTVLKEKMDRAVIFDGRNLYSPYLMKKLNIQYTSVGRPSVAALPELREETTLAGATTL